MNAVLRRATVADAQALADLAAVTFPLACPPYHSPENIALHLSKVLSRDAFARYAANPDVALHVAESPDGTLIGYVLVDYRPCDDEEVAPLIRDVQPSAEFSKLYVHPDVHGSGVALALFEISAADARLRGCASLWLTVWMGNARALRFYEKNDFAVVGERFYQVGELLDHDFVAVRVFSKGD